MRLEDEFRHRLDLYWGDITKYQLGMWPVISPEYEPLPLGLFEPEGFDLVLMDGHPLRSATLSPASTLHSPPTAHKLVTPPKKQKNRRGWSPNTIIPPSEEEYHLMGDRLLISQLILTLTLVSHKGGMIIMKLSKAERLITGQIIYLLDQISLQINMWKPVCMHATRDTFYVIARGVGFGVGARFLDYWIVALKGLWMRLIIEVSSRNGNGYEVKVGRRFQDGDLDFIIDQATLRGEYAARLAKLCGPVWETQAAAIRGMIKARKEGF
jgi:hypothetical protein